MHILHAVPKRLASTLHDINLTPSLARVCCRKLCIRVTGPALAARTKYDPINTQGLSRAVRRLPSHGETIMANEKAAAPAGSRKSEVELRKTLTPEQYRVTQEHGTERPFTHP